MINFGAEPKDFTLCFSQATKYSDAICSAEFYFNSRVAYQYALIRAKRRKEYQSHIPAEWLLSIHNDGPLVTVPFEVMYFDRVARSMIDDGLGHVKCLECDKVYAVNDLWAYVSGVSVVDEYLLCPSRHELLMVQVMNISWNEEALENWVFKDSRNLSYPKWSSTHKSSIILSSEETPKEDLAKMSAVLNRL